MPSRIHCPECGREILLPELLDGGLEIACDRCDRSIEVAVRLRTDPAARMTPPDDNETAGDIESELAIAPPVADERFDSAVEVAWSEPAGEPIADGSTAPPLTFEVAPPAIEISSVEAAIDEPPVGPACEAGPESKEGDESVAPADDGDDTRPPGDPRPSFSAPSSVFPALIDVEPAPVGVVAAIGPDLGPREELAIDGASAAQRRRPAQGDGLLRQFIGVVGGGALGLAIGYYLLNYFGGSRHNFLNIPLPGIPHTQPGWREADSPEPRRAPRGFVDRGRGDRDAAALDAAGDASGNATNPGLADSFSDAFDRGQSTAAADAPPSATLTAEQSAVFLRSYTLADLESLLPPLARIQPNDESELNAADYAGLCRIADVVTFLSANPRDDEAQRRVRAVERRVRDLAAESLILEQLGRLGIERLENPSLDDPGIVLAGRVESTGRSGDLYSYLVSPFGDSNGVLVLGRHPAKLESGDEVVILGCIVTEPETAFAGYSAEQDVVVWGGLSVKLFGE